MTGDPDAAITQALVAELREMADVECVLQPHSALTLAGLVQLALRHPVVSASTREVATRFLDGMRAAFADCPTAIEVLHRGDDARHDRRIQ